MVTRKSFFFSSCLTVMFFVFFMVVFYHDLSVSAIAWLSIFEV